MSINRTQALQIARRYATAIFALAVEAKIIGRVVEEFSALAAAIDSSAELREALASPILTLSQKAALLAAILKEADALTLRCVSVIALGGRAGLICTIAQLMHEMLAAQQGEVEATITSAEALSADALKQLAASLAKATGKKIQLKCENDPAVLGGVRIELGSLRLDATLAGALSNMRAHLLASSV